MLKQKILMGISNSERKQCVSGSKYAVFSNQQRLYIGMLALTDQSQWSASTSTTHVLKTKLKLRRLQITIFRFKTL